MAIRRVMIELPSNDDLADMAQTRSLDFDRAALPKISGVKFDEGFPLTSLLERVEQAESVDGVGSLDLAVKRVFPFGKPPPN